MQGTITILHLSDIHFRKKPGLGDETFRREVREKLTAGVKTHAAKYGTPGFVAITGNIAFFGQAHEYQEAWDFFEKLKAVLPPGIPFLPVPGNHDADRSHVDEFFSLQRHIVGPGLTAKFLENKKKIEDYINVKFQAFRDFAERLHPGLYETPADYYWVKNYKDQKVAFLGLNSAWASEGDTDRFHIELGYPQVRSALDKAAEIKYKVLLLHHSPFNWLKDMETSPCPVEIFKNCRLLLHGHCHADMALVHQEPGRACICLGANASYTNDKKGFIGYQFIALEFSEKGSIATVWPYIFSEKRREFVPDRERWSSQEGKPFFVLSTMDSHAVPSDSPGPPVPAGIPAGAGFSQGLLAGVQ